ncbi:Protein CBG24937 [Caenorhabditis briggsae]|uniref:Protein CBG24937 n=1 Tax=Caenorhabditis briggsae TaxID=6238 RepID=A8WLT1_CAEBR|nr:Protein CBG24937 [Caenorhabditis briggsae]CAP21428.1 Protein CBG24937 [Caenorhabditis briggsae]
MPKTVKLSSRPAFGRRIPDATSSDTPRVCVSTYLLDPSSDTRSGSLCILKAEKNQDLVLENEISTSAGVFRFDFRNPSTVVAALTNGSLVVQKIEEPTSSETTPVSSDMLLDLGLSDSSLTITTDNKDTTSILTVAIAELIPHLALFISLIGAFSGASMALLFPPIIELLTSYAKNELTSGLWAKNILLLGFAIVGFTTGTYSALVEIAKTFSG